MCELPRYYDGQPLLPLLSCGRAKERDKGRWCKSDGFCLRRRVPSDISSLHIDSVGPDIQRQRTTERSSLEIRGYTIQLTVEIPDNPSEALPVTVIADAETIAPFAGDAMLSAGGVLSILTVTDADMEFPALSVAVPEIS